MTADNSTLGHFLTFDLWKEALKLLNFQIACQKDNKHFKTLSMIYYKTLGSAVEELEKEDYFKQKVANNLFYGLEKEFAILPYVIPKPGLGLRKYKFLTYPMRALYYAVGLYLLKLSDEFMENYFRKRQCAIKSYYGGNISSENNELKMKNIYFKIHYKKFRNQIRKEISSNFSNKVVIKLDIQDYYNEISISTLLELLSRDTKPGQQSDMRFDATTKEQITFFFDFLANGGSGIPQSDNEILSNFIGYLYLAFGDLLIEDELRKGDDVVDKYRLIRYVDDIHISITFKGSVNKRNREEYVESLSSRVADILYYRLGLRLNPKTRPFWLDDKKQREELINSLKKVSPEYHISDDDEDDDETLDNKIENIFDELKKLKKASIKPGTFRPELQDEILKEVFDKRVNQMLEKDDNKQRIKQTFEDFNFNLVKEYPRPILIILLKEKNTAKRFRQFLLGKQKLTTRDVYLMLQYLCQKDFQGEELLELLDKLEQYEPMSEIIGTFKRANLSLDVPGYYDLTNTQTLELLKMPHAIEQIRYRVLSERTESYSVALNHLLNEIHAICYKLDNSSNHKNYDANKVIKFLYSKQVSHEICISIRNLFDRRNRNQVSHPSSEGNISWGVTADEYNEYRSQVGKCLASLL